MKQLIDEYAHYDMWANTRFVERLLREPDDLLDAAAPSSFPSLRATVLHIRDAEHAWYCRLTGIPSQWPAEVATGIETLLFHCQCFRDHVLGSGELALREELVYKDLRGGTHRQPAWQMIMHCLNHSTQHRGQLISQMRFLGLVDIPANDLVAYQRTIVARP